MLFIFQIEFNTKAAPCLRTQIYLHSNRRRFYVSYKQKSVDRNNAKFSMELLTSITLPMALLSRFFLRGHHPLLHHFLSIRISQHGSAIRTCEPSGRGGIRVLWINEIESSHWRAALFIRGFDKMPSAPTLFVSTQLYTSECGR